MTFALTDVQHALSEAIDDWAARTDPSAAVRAVEPDADARVDPAAVDAAWKGLTELGVFGIGVDEALGGAGGTATDVATAIESVTRALVPGPVVGTLTVLGLLGAADRTPVVRAALTDGAEGAFRAAVAGPLSSGSAATVADAARDTHLLVGVAGGDRWYLLPPGHPAIAVEDLPPLDRSRPLARVRLTGEPPEEFRVNGIGAATVRAATLAAAAAEAAGIASRSLDTAVEYAKVRVQFGRPIGSFQAIKQIAADMLCRSEESVALAYDAASSGAEFAAVAAAARTLDAAVLNAQDAIQVLGGIGFTWEHPAHLYLRRALGLRQVLGGSAWWRTETARIARDGARRTPVAVAEPSAELSAEAAAIAALPGAEQRRALADSGMLVPHWPAPYGRDADAAAQLEIDAALHGAGVDRPDLVIGAWAAPTVLAHGTPEQGERFVWPTLRGEITWCQLFSEPEAGSDLAALRTKAARVDGGWELTGQKVWTSLAHEADWAICLARTDPDAPKHKGITYFLVDMRSAGVEIRPLREITGDVRFNEVFLNGVFVPDELVVGEVNRGWRLARTTLANERVAMSGGATLGARLEALVAGADDADESLGGLVAEACACAALDDRATALAVDGRDPGPVSSVRKLIGVRHRQAVAEAALVRLGPEGAVADGDAVDVQYEALLTRCLSIAGGTSQILRNVAAERVLGLPRD
ncbi:acyl-CoA dehydrogenase [Tsukamurella sp. 1534]|uniref:acyl-CoA dehydrogenase n=1 Tax=Tsukamurella sp. 1534 TaxID=1151061 RepID=UPI0002E7AC7F|nr:acyl-CoA dehydrogenase [Tsukamurella sp. 1534]